MKTFKLCPENYVEKKKEATNNYLEAVRPNIPENKFEVFKQIVENLNDAMIECAQENFNIVVAIDHKCEGAPMLATAFINPIMNAAADKKYPEALPLVLQEIISKSDQFLLGGILALLELNSEDRNDVFRLIHQISSEQPENPKSSNPVH